MPPAKDKAADKDAAAKGPEAPATPAPGAGDPPPAGIDKPAGPDAGGGQNQQQPAPPASDKPATMMAPAPPAKPAAPSAGAMRSIRVPNERNGRQHDTVALALLRHVCEVFGVNPDADKRPEELLVWTYYPANLNDRTPAAVSIVTAGGQKLKLYNDDTMEDDTVQTLGRIFKLPAPAEGRPWTTEQLPEDLTLPSVMVTGMTTSQEHVYQGGYLRSGGKSESARRQALKKKPGK